MTVVKYPWLIVAAFLPCLLCAQSSTKRVATFSGTAGVVVGENAAKPLLQAGAGFSMQRWYYGAGAGYDGYFFHSYPLFAEGRAGFGKHFSLLAYAQAGYNFAAPNKNSRYLPADVSDGRLRGGFYTEAGLGYRFRLGNRQGLLVRAGYSAKELHYLSEPQLCQLGNCPDVRYNYRYRLGRLIAKLSWEFGKK